MLAVPFRDWVATVLNKLNTAQGFECDKRLLHMACQVSALVLEMTENTLCDAST